MCLVGSHQRGIEDLNAELCYISRSRRENTRGNDNTGVIGKVPDWVARDRGAVPFEISSVERLEDAISKGSNVPSGDNWPKPLPVISNIARPSKTNPLSEYPGVVYGMKAGSLYPALSRYGVFGQ